MYRGDIPDDDTNDSLFDSFSTTESDIDISELSSAQMIGLCIPVYLFAGYFLSLSCLRRLVACMTIFVIHICCHAQCSCKYFGFHIIKLITLFSLKEACKLNILHCS